MNNRNYNVINANYNSEVRKAISDRYVHYLLIRREAMDKKTEIEEKLNHPDSYSYTYYCDLQKLDQKLATEIRELEIKINTFDEAREICLNIAELIKN